MPARVFLPTLVGAILSPISSKGFWSISIDDAFQSTLLFGQCQLGFFLANLIETIFLLKLSPKFFRLMSTSDVLSQRQLMLYCRLWSGLFFWLMLSRVFSINVDL